MCAQKIESTSRLEKERRNGIVPLAFGVAVAAALAMTPYAANAGGTHDNGAGMDNGASPPMSGEEMQGGTGHDMDDGMMDDGTDDVMPDEAMDDSMDDSNTDVMDDGTSGSMTSEDYQNGQNTE